METGAKIKQRELAFHPNTGDLDDWESEELANEDRLEGEAAWEAAFEEGEQLARDTVYDDEEEDW